MKPPDPFVARPATLEDASEVAALMNDFDRAFLEEPDEMDATEVAGWWTGADLERETLVVLDPAGKPRAARSRALARARFQPGLVGSLARLLRPRRRRGRGCRDQRLSVRDGLGRHSRHARSVARPRARAGPAAHRVRRVLPPRSTPHRSRVDAGNETGATHLYESVGMRASSQADVYENRM